jgi:hypothetical protein
MLKSLPLELELIPVAGRESEWVCPVWMRCVHPPTPPACLPALTPSVAVTQRSGRARCIALLPIHD